MFGVDEWFCNFTQISPLLVTEHNLAIVKHPNLEYAFYWTCKSAQVTSIVAGLIVHPIYRLYRIKTIDPATQTPNTYRIIRNASRKLQGRLMLAGLAAGPLFSLVYTKFRGFDKKDVQEECYKIRLSGDELSMDRATVCLGFIGWQWKRFQGMVDGINASIAYGAFNHYINKPYLNPMLRDKFNYSEVFSTAAEAQQDANHLHTALQLDNSPATADVEKLFK